MMNTKIIHVCLISRQPSANITPLIDQRLAAQEVILVVSPEYAKLQLGNYLKQALKPYGIKVTECHISSAWNINSIRDELDQLVIKQTSEYNSKLILNCSGGTKAMSIAAYEVFYNHDLPVFYVYDDHIRWFFNPQQQEDFDLSDKIKLNSFLLCHGIETQSQQQKPISQELRDIATHWIANLERYENTLRTVNYLAYQAMENYRTKKHNDLYINLENHHLKDLRLLELLDSLMANQVLHIAGNRLVFTDEDSLFFTNGGWLEDYVFSLLFNIRSQISSIQDIAMSVNISSGGKLNVPNELDCAFLCNNRLYVIECKTKHFQNGSATEIIYKLDALQKQLGGTMASAMLVSYHPISDYDKDRATLCGIKICDHRNIKQLSHHLMQWLTT